MDDNERISHHDVEKLSEALARKDVAYLFKGNPAETREVQGMGQGYTRAGGRDRSESNPAGKSRLRNLRTPGRGGGRGW